MPDYFKGRYQRKRSDYISAGSFTNGACSVGYFYQTKGSLKRDTIDYFGCNFEQQKIDHYWDSQVY